MEPIYRRLKGYAFDPLTCLDLSTSDINEIIYKIPWEKLEPGPKGEYIHIIDHDPESNSTYKPVDLNHPYLLATDGISPDDANPQFHQQMVYAVVMNTIKNFEKALGRKVIWSPAEMIDEKNPKLTKFEYVPQLIVYPHGVRDVNAYYNPALKLLIFGYYTAKPEKNSGLLPKGLHYSCLSHDIIAHETTHALLDAVYSRYMEMTNPDIVGFHEGFADIIALFQRFTYPEIIRNQIRATKGNLSTENILLKLAVEFGKSYISDDYDENKKNKKDKKEENTYDYGSLRDALGYVDKKGIWHQRKTSIDDYSNNMECHERGNLLVSAVFDAFLTIYHLRTADLIRLATNGTGVLPPGEIHPDLVDRLADEASKTASHVLNMCIRALDYCPPIDLNYGDYLRALITADAELVKDDPYNYRVAFINAFRKRGIFPEGVSSLSVESLCYSKFDHDKEKQVIAKSVIECLKKFKDQLSYVTDRKKIFKDTCEFIAGPVKTKNKGLHSYLFKNGVAYNPAELEKLTGLVFSDDYKKLGIKTSRTYGKGPSVEIHSLRINNRPSPNGDIQNQIVLTLCQRAYVTVTRDKTTGKRTYHPVPHNIQSKDDNRNHLTLRGGCTLIFDLNTLSLVHVISKPIFTRGKSGIKKLNPARLEMQYRSLHGDLKSQIGVAPDNKEITEFFAHIHQPKNTMI